MAKDEANQAASQPVTRDPEEVTANDATMTIYGKTLGELIDGAFGDIDAAKAETAASNAKVEELQKQLIQKSAEVESLKAAVVQPTAARIVKLDDGSIRLPVVVPVDAATPLLSWAQEAGEDPLKYIQNCLNEALLAYTSS